MDGSNSIGMGCMAVFAVSGSIALLAVQAHKRLLSDVMKKIEFELGNLYILCMPHFFNLCVNASIFSFSNLTHSIF